MKQRTELSVISPVLWGIIGALAVWGIYLAIGATGYFMPDANLFDPRKPFVVIICSAAFLAFWWGNLRLKKRPNNGNVDFSERVNPCNWVSLLSATIGYALWGVAFRVSDIAASRLGYTSAFFFGIAILSAIIGISDPVRKKMKWAAMAGFLMTLLSFVLFFVQIRMYFDRTGAL